VLPFVNLSGDTGEEYFSDAMTEEVLTELAALAPDHLGVIARTTAMRYKRTQKDVAQIGRELSVDYLVEGGVRRDDDRIAITVQLIRVSDQTHLFARRYEAGFRDVFNMRRSIAESIAAQVGISPASDTPAGRPAIRKPTEDGVAYNLYVQGRHQWVKGTPESIAKAKQCFEEAISRDPRFALAYDALAELYWYLGFMGFAPAKDVCATGMFYALRALDIDDTLAETHALLGLYRKELDFNWVDVKREMDRALELNPTSPLVRLRYAHGWLTPECRLEDAAAQIELALESDPQSLFMRAWLGTALWLNRQYDRAIEQGRLMVELEPTRPWAIGCSGCSTGRRACSPKRLLPTERPSNCPAARRSCSDGSALRWDRAAIRRRHARCWSAYTQSRRPGTCRLRALLGPTLGSEMSTRRSSGWIGRLTGGIG